MANAVPNRHSPHPLNERDLVEYVKTYRYLRLGLVGVCVLLLASVIRESYRGPNCWLGSISAYYHTPVRSVFVGSLLAVGFGLILYRPSSDLEDALLNLAGMLAPLVAMIPSGVDDLCIVKSPVVTQAGADATIGTNTLQVLASEGVKNNVLALLIVGTLGILTALALTFLPALRDRKPGSPKPKTARATVASFAVAVLAIAAGWLLYGFALSFVIGKGHFLSAVLMFVLLAGVSLSKAVRRRQEHSKVDPIKYAAVAALMMFLPPLLFVLSLVSGQRDRFVLWAEIGEIVSFMLFWTIQTEEKWGDLERVRELLHVTGR